MSSRVIVSRFATHLTLVGVFLTGNVLCAFAPNYGVLVVARILIALVSGVLDVVFGAFSVRRRRLEYAGALHSGQSKGAQLLEITAETMIWNGLACASSAALLGAYCVRMSSADAMTVWLGAMRTPCAIFAGVMVSSMLVGMTIRETQLFRFFKQR